ncbi:MAG: hypothetical protein FWE21_10210 [Defluviitaleaceae bacterium]|nr:hypothetical protein [Defluviitaleaceae bacterium]
MTQKEKPDTEMESIKTDIIHTEAEIRKLMAKLADANLAKIMLNVVYLSDENGIDIRFAV